VGNNTGCFLYAPNEWMTFQVHVKIGTWYLNNNVFHRDSQIQLWAAREGQPSQLVIDTGLYASGQSPDPGTFTPNPNGGFDLANTSANAKYGKVWLLPYITAKDATQALPVSYVWYDDLIVSTQKIADPSVTSGPPDTTPPAAPVSLKIVN